MKYYILGILTGIKDAILSNKFIMFCLFGIINTFNTALFSFLAGLFIQDNLSAIIGYLVSLQGAYYLSCKYIFRTNFSFRKYSRFIISYIPSFIVYVLIHAGALAALELSQFWASFVAVILSGPLTFIIVKLYAFGKPVAGTGGKRSRYGKDNF